VTFKERKTRGGPWNKGEGYEKVKKKESIRGKVSGKK
jgi:hypothetical protein